MAAEDVCNPFALPRKTRAKEIEHEKTGFGVRFGVHWARNPIVLFRIGVFRGPFQVLCQLLERLGFVASCCFAFEFRGYLMYLQLINLPTRRAAQPDKLESLSLFHWKTIFGELKQRVVSPVYDVSTSERKRAKTRAPIGNHFYSQTDAPWNSQSDQLGIAELASKILGSRTSCMVTHAPAPIYVHGSSNKHGWKSMFSGQSFVPNCGGQSSTRWRRSLVTHRAKVDSLRIFCPDWSKIGERVSSPASVAGRKEKDGGRAERQLGECNRNTREPHMQYVVYICIQHVLQTIYCVVIYNICITISPERRSVGDSLRLSKSGSSGTAPAHTKVALIHQGQAAASTGGRPANRLQSFGLSRNPYFHFYPLKWTSSSTSWRNSSVGTNFSRSDCGVSSKWMENFAKWHQNRW